MCHSYFGTYSPLKKIVQMWKPIDFFNFFNFQKILDEKNLLKKFFFLTSKKFFCAWFLLLKYLFSSVLRCFWYKKLFLVPNWRNYLDLDAKDKLLYFTSLNPETRKIEKKNWTKKYHFFSLGEKIAKIGFKLKKMLNKE